MIFILLFTSTLLSRAQEADSLFAVKKDGNWEIRYEVKERENTRMLSNRFFVSLGQIEFANGEGALKKLIPGENIYIPITQKNYFTVKPLPLSAKNVHELYYKVIAHDDISTISNYCGVSKAVMRDWNNLRGNTLRQGQVLFIGWVKMMTKDSLNPSSLASYPTAHREVKYIDTTEKIPVPGNLDSVYNVQTNNGFNVLSEKGTAVFFEKPGKVTMYYAFHNEASRGSIIKVYNPGSGKTTYVKVLGPLPDTKLYANCIIGISEGAKEALGVTDNKAWCELYYAAD